MHLRIDRRSKKVEAPHHGNITQIVPAPLFFVVFERISDVCTRYRLLVGGVLADTYTLYRVSEGGVAGTMHTAPTQSAPSTEA